MPWRRLPVPIPATAPSELIHDIERLLAARHDVVTRRALLAAAVTVSEIEHALRSGRLHPRHAGVYARGRRELSATGTMWAAIAACGPATLLGGRAAAVRYGMLEASPGDRLALTTTSGARPGGVEIHRVRELPPGLVLDGIPILTPHAALRDECAGRRRVRPLVELLADGPRNTRSPVEDLVVPLLDGAGIARPERNAELHGWSVDFLWRAERVVLEIDSWTYHGTRRHYERDARTQEDLEARGYLVVRRTRKQVEREPTRVVARVVQALTLSSQATSAHVRAR